MIQVKTALKGLLADMAVTVSDDVQVTYGPVRTPERKWAFVGEANWQGADWSTNRSRTEQFSVLVGFSYQMSGGTPAEAEAYTVGLAAEFEDLLKADPSLGGLCVTSSFVPRSLKSWPIDSAIEALFETEVRATCRP